MKKTINLFCIVILILTNFYVPDVAHAKTLAELKSELKAKQAELQENQNQKQLTESEIKGTRGQITSIEAAINQTYTDIKNLSKEMEQLNKDIAEKNKEIKEILNFIQVSNGESAYLEYAFGAQDFTDFIYRVAIAEQLTTYNEELIDKYNKSIEDSKKKQVEITKKQASMAEQQKELEQKLATLGEKLSGISDSSVSIQDSIEYQKEIITIYENKGCRDSDDISSCGRKTLPEGTTLYRPTEVGQITSEWGYRDFAGRSWHEGIDTGVSEGTPVFAAGNGMVAVIMVRHSCGGNMVVVHHNIKGKSYTTVYAHLLSISVAKGQTVTRNTIIGYSGGYSTSAYYSGSYDTCSYGAHLHLTLATGLYGVDYYDWINDLNVRYSINPRSMINFPAFGVRWSDRVSAY